MGTTAEPVTAKEFSDAIVFDILSRLPVKSILRFKSLSKKWYVLLGNPQFIETHLNRSIERNDDYYLVTAYGQVDYFSFRSKENFEQECGFHFRLGPLNNIYVPVGSTNGLVCIREHDCSRKLKFQLCILLWNPATRELAILPKFPPSLEEEETRLERIRLGFGFDPTKNDYKVVGFYPSEESMEVFIYSLKTDKWTKIAEGETINMLEGSIAINVNGRMHWLGRSWAGKSLIFSFDVIEEKIIEMDLPEHMDYTHSEAVLCESPASLGKSLIYCQTDFLGDCETWFMKDYGDSKSWTKLYHFHRHPVYGWVRPNIFLDNGDIVMDSGQLSSYTCKNLLLHNPRNQAYKVISERYLQVVKYRESLVSIEGSLLASC